MEKIALQAKKRTVFGKKNAVLRASGVVPAVVYGHGNEATALEIDHKLLEKTFAHAGGNKIVELKIGDDKTENILFHDVQRDGRTGAIIHADLYRVKMDEKIKTEVPLRFIGESTAVYQDEGTLVRPLDAIEIEALPGNLPEAIEVDISILDDFEKSIHVSDLKVPAGVEILVDPEELVAKVEPPRTDAELEELEGEVVEELPEGVAEEQEAVKEENEGDKDKQPKPTE
jgi:large subunit ribosomal protein L25